MLTITSTTDPVLIPSDFKIEITGITDADGTPQEVTSAEFFFHFYVNGYGPYTVSNEKNSVIENGKLYFVFQNYPFKAGGNLQYRQLTKCPDTAFSDGTQDVWTQGQTTIILK